MGIAAPSHESVQCNSVCTCFTNDKNVTSKHFIRSTSSNWNWSNQHNTMLIECLTNDVYTIPLDIISMIKDYSHSDKHRYPISQSVRSLEKCYSKANHLLSKHLCREWFRTHCSSCNPLTIRLISKDTKETQQIMDGFRDNESSLPSLHSTDDVHPVAVTRTMIIDDCPVSIRLYNGNAVSSEATHVHLMILNEDDTIVNIDQRIRHLKAKSNVILVQTTPRNALPETHQRQLCINHNISFIKASLNRDKSIANMFSFAVKYHWFCSVNSE
eukprot:110811_1